MLLIPFFLFISLVFCIYFGNLMSQPSIFKPQPKTILPPVIHSDYVPHEHKSMSARTASDIYNTYSFHVKDFAQLHMGNARQQTFCQLGSFPASFHSFSNSAHYTTLHSKQQDTIQHLLKEYASNLNINVNTSLSQTSFRESYTNVDTPQAHTNPSGRVKLVDLFEQSKLESENAPIDTIREDMSSASGNRSLKASRNSNRGSMDEKQNIYALPANMAPPLGSTRDKLIAWYSPIDEQGLAIAETQECPVVLLTVDCGKVMQTGVSVIKHGRSGKPHTVQLQLSENGRYIHYSSKKKDLGESVVRFEWVKEIKIGQQSPVFQRYPDKRVESLSISITYTKPKKYIHHESQPTVVMGDTLRTLDFIIEDPNYFTIWYTGQKALLDVVHTKILLITLQNSSLAADMILQVPMVDNMPSSVVIQDVNTGQHVCETFENVIAKEMTLTLRDHSLKQKEMSRFILKSYLQDVNITPSSLSQSDILSCAYGSDIHVLNDSNIVDHTWVQQIVTVLPKVVHAYTWSCAYKLGVHAAGQDTMMEQARKLQDDYLQRKEGVLNKQHTFHKKVQGMGVLILRTNTGDIFGCATTQSWQQKQGWYGTAQSFVFRIERTITPEDQHLEDSIAQLHIYKWCGMRKLYMFQNTTTTGIGIGSSVPSQTPQTQPQPEGPALWIDKSLSYGHTQPCPTFASPALTLPKFEITALEYWVPLPTYKGA